VKVIITIPAWNEGKTIANIISDIKDVMGSTDYNYKILVFDDGSSDNTISEAKKAGAVVGTHRHSGLAETFRAEIKKCLEIDADVIVHIDADGQYYSEDIPRLIKEVENGYDLVLGSRFAETNFNLPKSKLYGNKLFARVLSNMLGIKLTDTTTGFRAFTRELASNIQYFYLYTGTDNKGCKTELQNQRNSYKNKKNKRKQVI